MTTNPLPDTPAHHVLMMLSLGDHQVSNYAAFVEARTIGAEARTPWADPGRFLETTAPPFGLPAIASVLLLATTNKLCQEVAVIPFLWVLPLALYLLSFIISFDHARWYRRGLFGALFVAGVAVVLDRATRLPGADLQIRSDVPIGAGLSSSAACSLAG